MATPDLELQIDQLYQLSLEDFTPARNALAKELQRPSLKDLDKPNIAAWAVNQLYWKERAFYTEMTRAGERLRGEHRKLLTGKPADIRDAEKAHREAIRRGVDTIRRLLKEAGHAVTEGTLTAVQETLEALPSDDKPGRLTRPLKPAGFEALAGIKLAASDAKRADSDAARQASAVTAQSRGASPLKLVRSATDENRKRQQARQREKEERERKERQRQAEKELKAAEAAMLRAESAVKKAEKALGELRVKRDEAVGEYQRARLRARE